MKNTQLKGSILIIIVSAIGVLLLLGFGACQNLIFDDEFERNGGIRLVLQVVTDEAINQELDQDALTIAQELKSKEIVFNSSKRGDGFFIKVSGIDSSTNNDVEDYLQDAFGQKYEIQNATIEGRIDFTVALREEEISTIRESIMHQAMGTIKHRLNEYGISRPRLRLSDENDRRTQDQIIVEFPNVDNPGRVKGLLSEMAQLKLCLVHEKYNEQFSSIQEAINTVGTIPQGYQLLPYGETDRNAPPQFILVQREAVITGKDLKNARASLDQNGVPAVSFFLSAEGGDRLAKITSENIGQRMAIVLDDKAYSAPEIRSKISSDGIITGKFTQQEAEDLALLLRSGALPAPLRILDEIHVPPVEQ